MAKSPLFIACIVLYAVACLGAPTVQLNLRDLQTKGIQLIASTDPSFESRLESLLGGPPPQQLEPLKRFSVLLYNNSAHTLIAYSVRWLCTAPDGETFVRNMLSPNLSPDRDNGLSILPGQFAFVSPFRAITSATASKERPSVMGGRGLAGGEKSDEQLANLLWQQASITVSIDGVVFDDGEFVGPDESRSYDMAVAITRARRQLIREFVERKASGQSDSAINTWLEAIANPPRSRGRVPIDWEAVYRSSAAWNLLQIKNSKGMSATHEFANNQLSRSSLQVWRRH